MHILDVSHKWFAKIIFFFLKKGHKIVQRIKREKNHKKPFFHCIVTKSIPKIEKWVFQEESWGTGSVFSKFHSLNCSPRLFLVCLFLVCQKCLTHIKLIVPFQSMFIYNIQPPIQYFCDNSQSSNFPVNHLVGTEIR